MPPTGSCSACACSGVWEPDALVVTNACGGVREDLSPGDLVLISDHLNLQGTSPLVGPNDDTLGPRFPDMSDAYDPALRAIAHDAAARLGQSLSEGVYAAWLGPAFETPAEIRMIRVLGGDLVGMSTVPEVLAARHMGLRCLAISCVTNMAAGILPEPIDAEHVLVVGAQAQDRLTALLARSVARAVALEAGGAYTSGVAPSLRSLPSVDRLLADERLADVPHPLALAAARVALDRAREAIRDGRDPGDLVEATLAELAASTRPSLRRVLNATGVLIHTNLGRAPLAQAALDRVVEVGGELFQPRVRPRRGSARIAPGPSHRAAAADHRRRGCARREQQRCRRDARPGRARRGPRGARLARRADRDRRRLQDPRRARPLGRPARRGRDDEPHAGRGLRACARPGDGRDPARAPVELPGRRLHRAARSRRAGRGCGRAPACRSSTISARARSRRSATSRPPRRASPPEPTSCASRATSSSAARRQGSSPGAPT